MKLIYRGIPYETAAAEPTTHQPSQATDKPAPHRANLRHPGLELTYRGVRYTP